LGICLRNQWIRPLRWLPPRGEYHGSDEFVYGPPTRIACQWEARLATRFHPARQNTRWEPRISGPRQPDLPTGNDHRQAAALHRLFPLSSLLYNPPGIGNLPHARRPRS
jgi:hypothetical protein